MSMWFTDATIAFTKETLSNLKNIKKQNAKLEEELSYYENKRNRCYIAIEALPDELRKNMYVSIESYKDMQEPVQLDEALRLLCKRVNELTEMLELGKQREDVCSNLLAEITKAYPGVLDEIND